MYENIKWDPTKRSTTTQTATDTAKILYEALWGLKDLRKATPFSSTTTQGTAVTNMTAVGIAIDRINLTQAGGIASFGSLYNLNKDDDTIRTNVAQEPKPPSNDKNTAIDFDPNDLPGHAGIPQDTDTMSMSTATKTTESTRLRLRETRDNLADAKEKLNQQTQLLSKFLDSIPKELHKTIWLSQQMLRIIQTTVHQRKNGPIHQTTQTTTKDNNRGRLAIPGHGARGQYHC
jgi:hypothetical protein